MAKQVDENGFWLIRKNPISKVGVFQYLGKSISDKLEPNRIYNVLRPESEISDPETVASFEGLPFIEDHEMIGEGFTPVDVRVAQGVVFNPSYENNTLYGDLKIFSESMKESIAAGKKELSLGYRCNYRLERGLWNGTPYDAVQTDIRGNHIALVDTARMGHDVRVYDHFCCDSIDVEISEDNNDNPQKTKKEIPEMGKVDKRKLIDEIGGILKDKVSEEIWRTVIGKAEEIAYNKSETGKADDEEAEEKEVKEEVKAEKEEIEKKSEDKCGEDSDKEEKTEEKKEEEEEEEIVEEDEFIDFPTLEKKLGKLVGDGKISEEVKAELLKDGHYKRNTVAKDSAEDIRKAAIAEVDKRNALAGELVNHIGKFSCDGMDCGEVALYACEKLGLDAADGKDAFAKVTGYLAAKKSSERIFSIDGSERKSGMSSKLSDYLSGK